MVSDIEDVVCKNAPASISCSMLHTPTLHEHHLRIHVQTSQPLDNLVAGQRGGYGVTNLEDCCVRGMCDQSGHGLPIRLPLAYVNSEGVGGRIDIGDDDGDHDGGVLVNFVSGDPVVLVTDWINMQF